MALFGCFIVRGDWSVGWFGDEMIGRMWWDACSLSLVLEVLSEMGKVWYGLVRYGMVGCELGW